MADCSLTGFTKQLITRWRSAHAWEEDHTKNSLCSSTGHFKVVKYLQPSNGREINTFSYIYTYRYK